MSTPKKNSLNLINKTDKSFPEAAFQEVLEIVQRSENTGNKLVTLILTADGSIRELNRKYLGKDALTDVISFPSEQEIAPFLGDIIIDIKVAESQKGKRDLISELQYLFLHGLLHLLGYDHISAAAKKVMKKKEIKYFSMIKEKI